MKRILLIVLAGLLSLPVASAALPGVAVGWGFWDHEDASMGYEFTCRGVAAVSGVRNAVPYGTLTLTFTFEMRPYPGRVDDCARNPEAWSPTTLAWTDATEDGNGRFTASRVDPCARTTIELVPGWSGTWHSFTVERERSCLGAVTDTFRGVVD